MARLFTCGFEENDIAALGSMWTAIGGTTPTLGTSAPHSGTYRLNTAASVSRSDLRWVNSSSNITTNGTIWYTRMYWRTTDVTPEFDTRIQAVTSGSDQLMSTLTLLTTGVLRMTNGTTGVNYDLTYALQDNTWYRIEHTITLHDAASGALELRLYADASDTLLDGISASSIVTKDGTHIGLRYIYFGTSASGSIVGVHSYDDLAVNDASGSVQTSWPGQGKIALLAPNADVSVTWTKDGSAPAGTNFGGVDDVPGAPDNGTTYNSHSGTGNEEDRLGLTDLGAEVPSDATMTLLDVYAKVAASASSGFIQLRVWNEGGTPTTGPAISVTNTTFRILNGAEHQVYSLTGKTKANIADFNAGYWTGSGAVTKWVSALWANVEWLESGAPPAPDTFVTVEIRAG